MLPFAALLIFSTMYCRFHYATDVLCALPFVAGVLFLERFLREVLPRGLSLPLPIRRINLPRLLAEHD
jgi:membrane-associated phospholipid phosphatase